MLTTFLFQWIFQIIYKLRLASSWIDFILILNFWCLACSRFQIQTSILPQHLLNIKRDSESTSRSRTWSRLKTIIISLWFKKKQKIWSKCSEKNMRIGKKSFWLKRGKVFQRSRFPRFWMLKIRFSLFEGHMELMIKLCLRHFLIWRSGRLER